MKKTILIITLIFCLTTVFSQNIKKGYKFIESEKYDKAVSIFDKALKKRNNTLESRYGLAVIYSKEDYSRFNPIKSYLYLRKVNLQFERLKPAFQQQLELDYEINQKNINDLTNAMADFHAEVTKEANTEQGYNSYLDIFEGTKQAAGIERHRDSIIYEFVKDENSFEAYRIFCYDYPNSYFVPQAQKKYQSMWADVYEAAYSECDKAAINKFQKQYPDYPFYDKKSNTLNRFAIRADNLNFPLGYIANNHDYYIKFIIDAAPLEPAFVALQRLIAPDLDEGDWNSAVDSLKKYQKYFPEDNRIDGLIIILNAKSEKIVSKSVGEGVNTKFYEYMPVLTADDKFMYFCAQDRKDNIGGEDIFVSQKGKKNWTKARLVEDLSTAYANEAPLSVSADGNTMLMFYQSDIYFSNKTAFGWSDKQKFPVINLKESWEADAFLTADGNSIIFISDRVGGIGNHHRFNTTFHGSATGNPDIYVSQKDENGVWKAPVNLGTAINTPFAERSPFLHPDMKTLYFSSEGHNSFGFLDVFKTTRLSDTSWTEWSEPVNMGKGINTSNKDWGYKISTSGEVAYYAYYEDGNVDINSLTLPEELQPERVAIISGVVTDTKKMVLLANIVWENLANGEKVGSLQSDPSTGNYLIALPLWKNYGFYVEKQGYYPLSGNIDLSKDIDNLNIIKNFELISTQSIISGEATIPLENVFFESSKYNLKTESFPELNRFVLFLKENNSLKIEIGGHTDNKGDKEYNKTLSENRAKSVKTYLVKNGCHENLLIATGYGDSKPIDDNSTDEGRANNRRVEFKVLK